MARRRCGPPPIAALLPLGLLGPAGPMTFSGPRSCRDLTPTSFFPPKSAVKGGALDGGHGPRVTSDTANRRDSLIFSSSCV